MQDHQAPLLPRYGQEPLLPCSTEGDLAIRADSARDHFGELLKSLALPENWREVIRWQMLAEAQQEGQSEGGRKLKKVRTIMLYKEGYIEEAEFQGEMAAVENDTPFSSNLNKSE